MGPLGHATHKSKAPAEAALSLDLAADHLEGPGLVTRHGAHVSAVEHDDGSARVDPRGLARAALDRGGLCRWLPAGRLDPQGEGMGAMAHARVVRRRGR